MDHNSEGICLLCRWHIQDDLNRRQQRKRRASALFPPSTRLIHAMLTQGGSTEDIPSVNLSSLKYLKSLFFQDGWNTSRSETSWRKSIVGSKRDNPSSEKNSPRFKRRLPLHPDILHDTAAAQEPPASRLALDKPLVKAILSDGLFLSNEYSSRARQQSRRRQQRINFSVFSVSSCSFLKRGSCLYLA